MPADQISDVAVVALPLKTKFRGIVVREALIFRGSQRWSEFSPFVEYEDEESSGWLAGAISWANDPLPSTFRAAIPVNATLPAVDPDEVAAVLSPFGSFGSVKIKVAEKGQSLEDDVARARKVRDLYPEAKIRLDANAGYTTEDTMVVARELRDLDLEYIEQPVKTIAELKELRIWLAEEQIPLKIAVDESIRKSTDPLLVAREQAADIAVIKVQPLGGIRRAMAIASESGLEIVVSSALETSIGISHGLHLAAAMPNLNYDCGLATAGLLGGDVVEDPLFSDEGEIELREVSPSEELLERYAASEERKAWWLDRLERCLRLLES
ncbi:MAG: o-succinylbenzoate synthase [Aquiluna sp.]